MSLYAIKKEFIKDVSEDLLEDERLKATLDGYPKQFEVAAMKIGHVYGVVETAETAAESTETKLMPDWRKMFEVRHRDVLEASLSLVDGLKYELTESELILPFGYIPEEGKEYVEDMVLKVPFYANSKKGSVRVVTVSLKARWEGETDEYKGLLNDFVWWPYFVGGADRTLDIDEFNLGKALEYSGKKLERIPGTRLPKIRR